MACSRYVLTDCLRSQLALAFGGLGLDPIGSPTLAGCEKSATSIALSFSGGASLLTQWPVEAYDMAKWAIQDSSSLMVCVGPQAAHISAEFAGAVERWRVLSREQQQASCLLNFMFWASAPLSAAPGGKGLLVDLSKLTDGVASASPLAVRYGWPLSKGGDTCCPFQTVKAGTTP